MTYSWANLTNWKIGPYTSWENWAQFHLQTRPMQEIFGGKISMPSVCNRAVRTLYCLKVFIFLSSTKGELLTGNQEFTGTTQNCAFFRGQELDTCHCKPMSATVSKQDTVCTVCKPRPYSLFCVSIVWDKPEVLNSSLVFPAVKKKTTKKPYKRPSHWDFLTPVSVHT